MPLHLIKLCVGAESIADLEEWIEERVRETGGAGRPAPVAARHPHGPDRAPPRSSAAARSIGSSRASFAPRQRVLEIEPFLDVDGIGRCRIWLDPKVVKVAPRPFRAFQGWRYFSDKDAPADLGKSGAARNAGGAETGAWRTRPVMSAGR